MGNLIAFARPKVSDALPDIHRINHKPIGESGSDSSLYESCFESEDEVKTSRPTTSNSTDTTKSFLSATNVSAHSSQPAFPRRTPTAAKTRKYHYNKSENVNKNATSCYHPGLPSFVEPSLMEDVSATSSDDDGEQSTGTEKVHHKPKREAKLKASTKNNSTDKNGDAAFLSAGSVCSNIFSSLLANPAGGDTHDVTTASTAAFSTAWEIDFDSEKSVTQPPKKLKQKLARKTGRKQHLVPKHVPSLGGLTNEIMAERKVMDLRRWHCISRPQYKKSCGLSSVVSVWNYLYSTLGSGVLPPITQVGHYRNRMSYSGSPNALTFQEEALYRLGFKPPFGEIRFGPFTGNATLMRWFRRLNDHYGVRGRAYYLYKPKGRLQTRLMTDAVALQHLKNGLADDGMAFIYHCLNHYFCPVGYEDTPHNATEAYYSRRAIVASHEESVSDDALPTTLPFDTWIMIGEPSRRHPPFHCKRWSEILEDLHTESPKYFNIRHSDRGIQERKSKKKGGNLHCLLAFKKIQNPSGK